MAQNIWVTWKSYGIYFLTVEAFLSLFILVFVVSVVEAYFVL